MSDKDLLEDLEVAMNQAKGSMKAEGFTITEKHNELVRAVLTNKMTEKEFFEKVDSIVFRETI